MSQPQATRNLSGETIHHLHGDIGLHPLTADDLEIQVPKKKSKRLEAKSSIVLQASPVTGNSHVLRSIVKGSLILHWWVGTREFVYCSAEYKICHEGPETEHGIQFIAPGIREVRHEKEYNPFLREIRVVVD